MIRIAISVEGQSEEAFVKSLLIPFFRKCNIELTPIIVTTSKDSCGRKHKGGCININRIKNEIKKLLPTFDYVTTFYDFYGFKNRNTNNVDELEKKLYELFNNHKFIPYIQKYEFETLLFCKPEYFNEYFLDDTITKEMRKIINEFNNDIEDINDSPATAPSKRIKNLFEMINEKYDKVFYGEAILSDIGLEVIKQKAKRFNTWIEKIKSLGDCND